MEYTYFYGTRHQKPARQLDDHDDDDSLNPDLKHCPEVESVIGCNI